MMRLVPFKFLLLTLLCALLTTGESRAIGPQYEIIDVKIMHYLGTDGSWTVSDYTDGFIAANGKDFPVQLGRGWLRLGQARYIQKPFTLLDLVTLFNLPTQGYNPELFPFVPELAGNDIVGDLMAEGDPSQRRWYLKDGGANDWGGYVALPVGTSIITFDAVELDKEGAGADGSYWVRTILYEAKEGYIELEPSGDEEGYDFDNPEDIANGETDSGLDFDVDEDVSNEPGGDVDMAEIDSDEEGMEFELEDDPNVDPLQFDETAELDTEPEGFDFDNPEDIANNETDDPLQFNTSEDLSNQDLTGDEEGMVFELDEDPDTKPPQGDEPVDTETEPEGFDFDNPEDREQIKRDMAEEALREKWDRPMTIEQMAEAEARYDELLSCAETGANCPDGYSAEAMRDGLATDREDTEASMRELAMDDVLGPELDERGWPKSMTDEESRQAQADFVQMSACATSSAPCPDYIDKATLRLYFEMADSTASNNTIREIIANEVSKQSAARYEDEE